MSEKFEEPFRRLARTVQSVQKWAETMLKLNTLKPKDWQLVEKLQKYAERCQKTPENWSSKSAAHRTLKKLDNL